MKIIDSITREVKIVTDFAKSTLTENIIQARQTKLLQLTEQQLGALIKIIEVSVDEAYQKSINAFQKSISKYLTVEKKKK